MKRNGWLKCKKCGMKVPGGKHRCKQKTVTRAVTLVVPINNAPGQLRRPDATETQQAHRTAVESGYTFIGWEKGPVIMAKGIHKMRFEKQSKEKPK